MRNRVKKYLSVFFLILFLLPIIGKGIHTHHYVGESHFSTSEKQFYSHEDHCFICDYTSFDCKSLATINYLNPTPVTYFLYSPFIEDIYFQNAFLHLSLRAPPVASFS